jgi:Uma2 family endonuclease
LTLPQRYGRVAGSRRRADGVIWVGLGRIPDTARDVPSIMVEFVSKARRDRERDYELKRRQYLDLGVKEDWLIDRFQRTLRLLCRDTPRSSAEPYEASAESWAYRGRRGFSRPR